MRAVLDGRDSLVVLPTGGGKSLCYQAPAVAPRRHHRRRLAAHRPDEGPGGRPARLRRAGRASSTARQTAAERHAVRDRPAAGQRPAAVRLARAAGQHRLLPRSCRRSACSTFAIDEAHCISHWGHDFRPEYRQLGRLRELFPGASVHAYTATATEQVRARHHATSSASHDPRCWSATSTGPTSPTASCRATTCCKQVLEVLDRHKGEAGIIYCLRRARRGRPRPPSCSERGINARALPRRPGHRRAARRRRRRSPRSECDIVVATVAFGMGIDRSNVRFVLHAGMPKSIEHYQQETGRAGRDGLEAECVLLYSGGDVMTMQGDHREVGRAEAGRPIVPARRAASTSTTWTATPAARSAGTRPWCNYFGQDYDDAELRRLRPVPGRHEEVPDAAVGRPEDPVVRGPREGELRRRPRRSTCCAARTPSGVRKCGPRQADHYGLLAGRTPRTTCATGSTS